MNLPEVGRTEGRTIERIVVHVRLSWYPRSLWMRVRSHRAGGPRPAHTGRALGLHTGRPHHAGRAHRMGRWMMRRADHMGPRVMGMGRRSAAPHVRMGRVGRAAHHAVRRHRMGTRRGAVQMGRRADPGVRGRRAAVRRRRRRLGRRQARGAGRARARERRQRAVRHVVELGERGRRRRHRLQRIRGARRRVDA